jgi:hypothetical protein
MVASKSRSWAVSACATGYLRATPLTMSRWMSLGDAAGVKITRPIGSLPSFA